MDCNFITLDKNAGTGSALVGATAPTWRGRLPRETSATFISDLGTHDVKFIQNGIDIIEVDPTSLFFDKDGGCELIQINTNAESLNMLITNLIVDPVSAFIKDIVINGIPLSVNDISFDYAIPGDPGQNGTYYVEVSICMPQNDLLNIKSETLTINGKQVSITQEAFIPSALDVVCPEDANGNDGTSSIIVTSNTEWIVDIIECEEHEVLFELDRYTIVLDQDGSPETVDLTSESSITWEIKEM